MSSRRRPETMKPGYALASVLLGEGESTLASAYPRILRREKRAAGPRVGSYFFDGPA
jgi:hypothetical protein